MGTRVAMAGDGIGRADRSADEVLKAPVGKRAMNLFARNSALTGAACEAIAMSCFRFGIYAVIISISAVGTGYAASPAASAAVSPDEAVDLFAAKNAGQVSVRLIPHDEKSGQVLITNNTSAPLTIKLPEAFAGVPILAQRGGGG